MDVFGADDAAAAMGAAAALLDWVETELGAESQNP